MAKSEYKNVGDHVEIIAGGRSVGIGETVELTDEDVKDSLNARLIEAGKLIPATKSTKQKGDDE